MGWMIWAGTIATLAGLGGIIWCIRLVLVARRSGDGDDALKRRLQKVVALNMAALGVSALGLAMVVTGLFLR